MARIPEKDVALLLDLISRFPLGASLEEILIGLTPPPSRRTLQYRLASLVKQGRLIAAGNARARRYHLPVREEFSFREESEGPVLLSTEGKIVQFQVTRPIQQRTPVSYQREFLDRYQPNKTYYLSETIRKKLFDLGKTELHRPAGTYARQIFSRLLIDLSWNSSRLEGNTYSLLETERLLELGEAAKGKDQWETQMILNHKAAIEFLVDAPGNVEVNRYTILNLHALLADGLLPAKACGALRSIPVAIGRSVYLPLAVPQLIEECFAEIIAKAQAIKSPFEQAFFLMVHLPYLQPFEDVNKRVSRLAVNLPLIRENLCPLSFVDVPQLIYVNGLIGVYELNKVDLLLDIFVWAYERSVSQYSALRRSYGEPDPFRMQYQALRKETVSLIVRKGIDKRNATDFIRQRANKQIPAPDRIRFIEMIEAELAGLHEGNIARYGLSPAEFKQWKQHW